MSPKPLPPYLRHARAHCCDAQRMHLFNVPSGNIRISCKYAHALTKPTSATIKQGGSAGVLTRGMCSHTRAGGGTMRSIFPGLNTTPSAYRSGARTLLLCPIDPSYLRDARHPSAQLIHATIAKLLCICMTAYWGQIPDRST